MWNSKTTENNHEKESTEYRFEPENRNPETLTGGKDKHNDEENFVDLRDIEIKTENGDHPILSVIIVIFIIIFCVIFWC
jgi:hypothetical protein